MSTEAGLKGFTSGCAMNCLCSFQQIVSAFPEVVSLFLSLYLSFYLLAKSRML